MGDTSIEWTNKTWNPIRGCSRVSAGCLHCYAEGVANRFSFPGGAYDGLVRIDSKTLKAKGWNGRINFVEQHLMDPLRWRKPQRIFVNSTSDLFHKNVTDDQIDIIFGVMAHCPQHIFQVLTKRPERMLKYLTTEDRAQIVYDALVDHEFQDKDADRLISRGQDHILKDDPEHGRVFDCQWPLPNVHLGVSTENQATADERIPLLLQTPAAVRFISAEPLLGAVDLGNLDAHQLSRAQGHQPDAEELEEPWKYSALEEADIYWGGSGGISDGPFHAKLNWVICGGESGPGARPMHPDWARGLRDQCAEAGVPFFFKQWGEWAPSGPIVTLDRRAAGEGIEMEDVRNEVLVRCGKKAAGALLDGKMWREFPHA